MNAIIVFLHLVTLLVTLSILVIWFASKLNFIKFFQLIINPVSTELPDMILFIVQMMCITLIICLVIIFIFWLYQIIILCRAKMPDPKIDHSHQYSECITDNKSDTVDAHSKFKCNKCICNICEIFTMTLDGSAT